MLAICLSNTKPLFKLGQVVMTHGAINALKESGQSAAGFLDKHIRGDWGDLSPQDAKANEDAITEGLRILSVYRTSKGIKIWIITEADRASTCLLLPDEY
jgi:hypothetical protein